MWRDPEVAMKTRTKYRHAQGFDDVIEKVNPVHWRMGIKARRGDLRLASWIPRTSNGRDLFPVVDVLPSDGFTSELSWDVPEQQAPQTIAWNKPIALYWRRPGAQNLIIQVALTPYWDDENRRTRPVDDLSPKSFAFGIKAAFRTCIVPGPVIALSPDAKPSAGAERDLGIYPTWYEWADRAFLGQLLAGPEKR